MFLLQGIVSFIGVSFLVPPCVRHIAPSSHLLRWMLFRRLFVSDFTTALSHSLLRTSSWVFAVSSWAVFLFRLAFRFGLLSVCPLGPLGPLGCLSFPFPFFLSFLCLVPFSFLPFSFFLLFPFLFLFPSSCLGSSPVSFFYGF